ncbi:MAG: tocopherol cyclase family protein [Actinomycetales bacterium]|nr:tocopherol cyclase family protein [Actinomycetales bacterium]
MGLLTGVRHPEGFHGAGVTSSYFEGWYVKLVSADRRSRWAVIPGVFLDPRGGGEAFVQVLDGATGASWYHRYDESEFGADDDRFAVRVGPNRFSDRGVVLDLPSLAGEVRFATPLDPWPVSWRSPGVMGWYAWVPRMECKHGVVSLGHDLAGSLEHGGGAASFDGGRGYCEKDWGAAFPAAYVWMQTNHFDTRDTCLTASVALIPWVRSEFRGHIVGLLHRGELHRFATYTGAVTTRLEVDDDAVRWHLRSKQGSVLELTADRPRGGLLHAPVRTEMHRRVEETLDATIHVRLLDPGGRVLLDDVGTCGGLEVHGDLPRLLASD